MIGDAAQAGWAGADCCGQGWGFAGSGFPQDPHGWSRGSEEQEPAEGRAWLLEGVTALCSWHVLLLWPWCFGEAADTTAHYGAGPLWFLMQGACGSCWTFSTTGCLESAIAIATGKLLSLVRDFPFPCTEAGPVSWHGWELAVPVTIPSRGPSALLKQDGVQGRRLAGPCCRVLLWFVELPLVLPAGSSSSLQNSSLQAAHCEAVYF